MKSFALFLLALTFSFGRLDAQVMVNLLKDINTYQTPVGLYNYPVGAQLAHANGQTFFFASESSTGLELWKAIGTTTSLVKDITPGTGSTQVTDMIASGSKTFLIIRDNELWVTDGSTTGTQHLKTFTGTIAQMIDFNGVVVFNAITAESGRELWRSDGTLAGTFIVQDIFPGTSGSDPGDRIVINNTLYFSAIGSIAQGREFWKTDGTSAGTVMVKDLYSINSTSSSPHSFVNANGTLYFIAICDGVVSFVRSDGTASGTTSVASPYPFNNPVQGTFTAVGDRLFFLYRNSERELWSIANGQSAATLVKSFFSTPAEPTNFQSFKGLLYFLAADTDHGYELWKSDGSTVGTAMVKDANPGIGDAVSVSDPYPLITQTGGYLYYVSKVNGYQLTQSDGTTGGTQVVTQMDPDFCNFQYLYPVGEQIYFMADDFLHGPSIWRTDESAASGAVLVKDVDVTKSLDTSMGGTIFYNGFYYFMANDSKHGFELWRSDGTPAGTTLFMDLKTPASLQYHSSYPDNFTIYNDKLYFAAEGNDGHRALWRTDGTVANTIKINDVPDVFQIQVVNGKLVIISKSSMSDDRTLYFSDGIPGGATSYPQVFKYHGNLKISADGSLGFVALTTTATGQELWRTDGTVAGTYMLNDIFPGPTGSTGGAELTELNGIFYFSAAESFTFGTELWRTDGTSAGTYKLKDICTGSCNGSPLAMTVIDQYIYFTARDAVESWSMYRTDGTAVGTQFLFSPVPGYQDFGAPIGYQDVNGKIVYINVVSTPGGSIIRQDIWSMDKVTLVHTRVDEGAFLDFFSTYKLNNRFYTVSNHANTGREMWKSDGTVAGTSILKDVNPGTGSSLHPYSYPNVLNNALYFIANDGSSSQLWKSDGDCSTIKITQTPGDVKYYFIMGSNMVLLVDHPNYGIEPFYYLLADEPELLCRDDQIISFMPLTERAFANNLEVPLEASSDSGLPVSFSSDNPTVATVENGKLLIHGAGDVMITATQPGNNAYNPATPVTQAMRIVKGNQEIIFAELPEMSMQEVSFVAEVSSTSGLTISLSASNELVSVNGLTVTLLAPGDVLLTAMQEGNANFNAAEPVSQPLSIQLVTGTEDGIEFFRIYPNPAKDVIRFDPLMPDKTVDIISIVGGVCTTLPVDGNSCDISMLQPGMYFLQWKKNSVTQTAKIVIAK